MVKRKLRSNNRRVDWENDAKEQISLAMGSAEYKEYQEDLRMHDPFRPDDDWHDKLEEQNAEYSKPKPVKNANDTGKNKFIREQRKRAVFNDTKDAVIKAAAKTETKEDDKCAKSMKLKDMDEIIFDDGADEEDYMSRTMSKYLG